MNSPEGPEVGISEERLQRIEELYDYYRKERWEGLHINDLAGDVYEVIAEVRRLRNYMEANEEERMELAGCSHVAELQELEALRAQPCPHVVTGDEGTAYCDLAESSVLALRAENEALRDEIDELLAERLLLRERVQAFERNCGKGCECFGKIAHGWRSEHAQGCPRGGGET